ncbi:MAG: TonB-dependent receptor [Bacteroidia bacterium]|nr:TonB-dependent receptor [Bacteroidia bacterium]
MLWPQCPGIIFGKVTDRHSKEELGDADVILLPENITQKTDPHGEFRFTNVCYGKKQILIRHRICPDTTLNLEFQKDIKLKINLNHYYNELNEIPVSEKLPEFRHITVSDNMEGNKMDEARGTDLADIIRKIPGVSVLQTGPTVSKPMIHGMHGYRVLIVNHGIRHEAQQWGSEHAPEMDPFVYDRTEVIKGAGTIRYGSDAVAGVIASAPSELPDTTGLHGEVFTVAQTNGRGGQMSGKLQGNFNFLKGLSWRIQGSIKHLGDRRAPSYYITNTGSREWNGAYELQYRLKNSRFNVFYTQFNSRIGIFTGAHIGNLTDLQNILHGLSTPYTSEAFSYEIKRPMQKISHEMVKAAFGSNLGKRWILNVHYAFQYNARSEFDKHTSFNNKNAEVPDMDYRVQTSQSECSLEHLLMKGFKGKGGVQFLHQINNSFGRFFIPNYVRRDIGFFLTESYSLPHWKFEGGIRYDYRFLQSFYYLNNEIQKPVRTFDNLAFQASVNYEPFSFLNIVLQGGNAWRAPGPNELYSNGLHHGVGGYEKGNPDLKKESGLNGNAFFELNLQNVYIKSGYFIHDFSNFIYLQPTGNYVLSIQGAFPEFEYRQSAVRIQGVECSWLWSFNSRFEFHQNATLLRAVHTKTKKYLIYMPADRIFSSFRFYFFKTQLKEMWAEIQHSWIDKQARVPMNEDFAPPPAGYQLWNLQAGIRLLKQKYLSGMMLMLEIQNLLDVAYRDYLDRFRYFTDLPGRNFVLKLKIPFNIKKMHI